MESKEFTSDTELLRENISKKSTLPRPHQKKKRKHKKTKKQKTKTPLVLNLYH